MIYLSHFSFPDKEEEYDFIFDQKRTCYDTVYPFQIISRHDFTMLDPEQVTILYGGNGSGKSTVLNVIAEKLGLKRWYELGNVRAYYDFFKKHEKEFE